jgi:dephospho-CoA kinase
MLEHLGAYGIDADALSHRAIAKGAPGYQPIVDHFGRWILNPEGQIDRAKLGKVVFADPEALAQLEAIVHPMVRQALDIIIQRATQRVVVIEAIKLLESGISKDCDAVWVSYAPEDIQRSRLMEKRHLSQEDADLRIKAQEPQENKVSVANVVVKNIASFEDTWKQVASAWQTTVPYLQDASMAVPTRPVHLPEAPLGQLTVQRARPRHSGEIASLVNRLKREGPRLSVGDIMESFGEKAFLLLIAGQTPVGVIGWQVENLVARTTDIYLDPSIPLAQALPELITEMERASRDLQSEASLVFSPPALALDENLWKKLGYDRRTPQSLGIQAWQEAAQEYSSANTVLYFKQLRQDRILRPI